MIPADAAGLRVAASLEETEVRRGVKYQIFPMRCKASESLQISYTTAAPESAVTREYVLVGPCLPEVGATSPLCSNGWANMQAFQTRHKANQTPDHRKSRKPCCGQAVLHLPAAEPREAPQLWGADPALRGNGLEEHLCRSSLLSRGALLTCSAISLPLVNSVALVIAIILITILSPKSIPNLLPSH